MLREFPLFQSPIDLAHQYWKQLLKPGDHAIDATCGNGKDTLMLAELLFSHSLESSLIGMDIQAEAIERTRALLSSHLSQSAQKRVFLYQQSHASFPAAAYQVPVRLIVYNFGYLPQGDKAITTLVPSSVSSVRTALDLLMPQGMISATLYPGHPEGMREQTALLALAADLEPSQWCVTWHTFPNRTFSPTLLLLQKNK